jgi:hypothetical protein
MMGEWRVARVGETYVMARMWTFGRWEVRRCGIVEVVKPRRVRWHGWPGSKLAELVLA